MAKNKDKVDAYMPWWIGDYLADTTHLTTEQHGAYLLLIASYWRNGGPLDADEKRLAATCRMTAGQWKRSRDTVLAFFRRENGMLHHKRIDAELNRANERKAAARRSADARWRTSETDANAMRTHNQRICETDAEAMPKRCSSSPSPESEPNTEEFSDSSTSKKVGVLGTPPPEYGQTVWAMADNPPIPPPLDSVAGFAAAWEEYLSHVNGKGRPLTQAQARRLLARLTFEPDKAVQCLEHSIERGWLRVKTFVEVEIDRRNESQRADGPPRGRHITRGEAQDAYVLESIAAMAARKEVEHAGSENGRPGLALVG